MLFEIFRITKPPWFQEYLAGRRVTSASALAPTPDPAAFRKSKMVSAAEYMAVSDSQQSNESTPVVRGSLIDSFLGLVLVVFVDVGLMDSLVSIAEEPASGTNSRMAALLIGELLQLANRVLPPSRASELQVRSC